MVSWFLRTVIGLAVLSSGVWALAQTGANAWLGYGLMVVGVLVVPRFVGLLLAAGCLGGALYLAYHSGFAMHDVVLVIAAALMVVRQWSGWKRARVRVLGVGVRPPVRVVSARNPPGSAREP